MGERHTTYCMADENTTYENVTVPVILLVSVPPKVSSPLTTIGDSVGWKDMATISWGITP